MDRKVKPVHPICGVIAFNVLKRMRDKYMPRNCVAALADAADITMSSVQRVLDGQTAIRVDTLAKIADALGVHPWELLRSPDADIAEPRKERR
jgi:transcriptional regulator with XRE-family HTH domain